MLNKTNSHNGGKTTLLYFSDENYFHQANLPLFPLCIAAILSVDSDWASQRCDVYMDSGNNLHISSEVHTNAIPTAAKPVFVHQLL